MDVAGLAYVGISVYINYKMGKAIGKGYRRDIMPCNIIKIYSKIDYIK